MSYTDKAVKGTLIIFIISIFAAILGYFVRISFARNLTAKEFGLFYAVFTLISVIYNFRDLGLGSALVKFIPNFVVKNEFNKIKSSFLFVLYFNLISSFLLTFVLFLSSNFLSIYFFHTPAALIVIRWLAVSYFFISLADVLRYSFQGFQKMQYYAFFDFIKMGSILALSSILFYFGNGLFSPLISYLIYPLILILIFSTLFLNKVFPSFFKTKFSLSKKVIKKLFSFGIPVVFGTLGIVILGYTDSLMLTYFSGLKQVGLYNISLPTARLLLYFSIAIGTVLFPLVSELWDKKEKKKLREGINKLYHYFFMGILPFALIMFAFPETIIKLFFGNQYLAASTSLQILSIGLISFSFANINFNILSGLGKPKVNTKIVYTAALFNIIFNFILIPRYGIIGASITTFIGYLIMAIFSFNKLKDILNLKLPYNIWKKTFFSGVIFIGVIYFMKKVLELNFIIESIICIFIGLMVYFLFLIYFKVITLREIKMVRSLIK